MPTIEILDMYLISIRASLSQNVTPAGTGFITTTLGPTAGELWYLRSISAVSSGVLPAAATISFSVGFQPGGNAGFFIGLADESRPVAVGERGVSVGNQIAVLQPGDLLGCWVTNFAGAPGNLRVTANIARLTI